MLSRNFRFLVPGFRVDPQYEVPGFNLDESNMRSEEAWPHDTLPATLARIDPDASQQPAPSLPEFATPTWPSLAPPGLAQFRTERQNDVPGFNLRLADTVPGFNLVEGESGVPYLDTSESDSVPPSPHQQADTALALPKPSVEGSNPLDRPELPEWLHKVLATSPPPVSTAVAPRTGMRVISHEPLPASALSYSTGENRLLGAETADGYVDGIGPLPDLDSTKPRSAEQRTSTDAPARLADFTPGGGERHSAAVRPQPMGTFPAQSARRGADPGLILANFGSAGETPPSPQEPPPQDKSTQEKEATIDAWSASKPPASRPQQPSQGLLEEYGRSSADLIEELAGAVAKYGSRFYQDTIVKMGDDIGRFAERFADDPVATTLSVLNSFPQTRVEGEFLANFAAVFTLLAKNYKSGMDFERAAIKALAAAQPESQIAKNTTKISGQGPRKSVPDILLDGITEIKNSLEINHTPQLKVQIDFAKANKKPFNLVVSPNTRRISQEVKDAVEKTGGTIQRFDDTTGIFTPF